jgi:hypothetical protein
MLYASSYDAIALMDKACSILIAFHGFRQFSFNRTDFVSLRCMAACSLHEENATSADGF